MDFRPAPDVPLQITSPNTSSERRIKPGWSISELKTRMEPVTGVPASAQRIVLKVGSQAPVAIEAADEDGTQLGTFPLQAYAEMVISDTRPAGAQTNFTDVSAVQKWTMPEADYEQRTDSVLAWKKAQKLGRFDPDAPAAEQAKIKAMEDEITRKGIKPSLRCRLLPPTSPRHGTVRYVGLVPEIPGSGPWVGVELDEPTGKNDGAVGEKRYFECPRNCGSFVRPERVEVGDFPVVGLEDEGEEMEEI